MESVYIAGPYTKPCPSSNTLKAMAVWHEVSQHGLAPFCPHLNHFLHLTQPRDYHFWLKHDIIWLKKCDYLLRLPGESNGADMEIEIAKQEGIPVFYSIADLMAAIL